MAEQASGLEVLIRSILDAKGFEELKSRLSEATEQTKAKQKADEDASESSKKFGDSLSKLGEELLATAGAVIGVEKAFEFFKDSLKEAVEGEKVMYQFAAANEALAGSSEKSKEENEQWLLSVQQSSGIVKSELLPAYMKLLAATGSVDAAQGSLQVAAGAAAAGFGDVSSVSQKLAKFLLAPDGPVKATDTFGLYLKKLHSQGLTTSQVLETLGQKFGDAGAHIDNNAMKIARAKIEWNEFKEQIGQTAIGLLQYLKPAMEVIELVIVGVIVGVTKLNGYVGILQSSMGTFFHAIVQFIEGDYKKAYATFTNGIKDIPKQFAAVEKEADKLAEKLTSSMNKSSEGIKGTKAVVDGMKGGLGHAQKAVEDLSTAITRMEMQSKLAAHGEEDLQQKLIEGYKRVAQQFKVTGDDKLKIDLKIRESEQKLTDMETAEVAKREKFAEQAEKKRLSEEDKTFKKKLAAQEKALKIAARNDAEYYKSLLALYGQDLASYTLTVEEKEDVAARAEKAQEELNAKQAKNNADMNAEILDSAITTLGNAFGIGKEIAIANAIINTYEGATKALAQGGILGEVMAAIVIATGIAQIATIASTNPGTTASTGAATATSSGQGFDDPAHDFKAYVGGQKWADDMVGQFSAGATAGFKSQMVNNDNRKYSTSTQQNKTTNFNIKAPGYVDAANKAGMRRFVRELQIADTLESARTPK
jgi:hypothetical protein